jgi:hypothetical protein
MHDEWFKILSMHSYELSRIYIGIELLLKIKMKDRSNLTDLSP